MLRFVDSVFLCTKMIFLIRSPPELRCHLVGFFFFPHCGGVCDALKTCLVALAREHICSSILDHLPLLGEGWSLRVQLLGDLHGALREEEES